MARYNRVFYAFPGEPAALRETINNAIDLLKDKPQSTEEMSVAAW